MFCSNTLQAAKQELVYPNFAWILYPKKWWTNIIASDHLDECTEEELNNFLILARPLIMHIIPEPDDEDVPTDTGFVRNDLSLPAFFW